MKKREDFQIFSSNHDHASITTKHLNKKIQKRKSVFNFYFSFKINLHTFHAFLCKSGLIITFIH